MSPHSNNGKDPDEKKFNQVNEMLCDIIIKSQLTEQRPFHFQIYLQFKPSYFLKDH